MSVTHYCRPSDILSDLVVPTLTSGTADANFPLTNINDRKSHTVFKSTGTSATIQWAFGVSKTLQAVAIINHKLAGATVTLTNSAGLSQAITIPANSEDGHCIDPWKTLIGLANTSAATWSLVITGAATVVAIGEVLLVQTLRDLMVLWGIDLDESHGAIIAETDYGVRLKYGFGVRQRAVKGRVNREHQRANLVSLQRDAAGPLKNFLLVVDNAINDALYVDLTTVTRRASRNFTNVTEMEVEFTEQQKGLAL